MGNKRIVGLVPMRHHSERIAGKNFRKFNGRPLHFWILKTLLACRSIEEIYINTDSPAVKEQASQLDPRIKIIDRPSELCGDEVPMNEILLYDVKRVEADYYLQTHSTNPLLTSATIERAINAFLNSGGYDSLVSVTRLQTRLWDQNGKALNHNPDILGRTQDLPPVFEENSNIYVFDKQTLQNRKNRIGYKPLLFEIAREEAIDIDEEGDFRLAEQLHRLGGNP